MLETKLPGELEARSVESRWLIEGLWASQAVGVLGGEPKCCKSFLGLEFAVSVASGECCLGRFAVREVGPVLLFQAEDAEHVVRARLEGIALAKGVRFDELPIHVLTESSIHIDQSEQQIALEETVARLKPKLMLLDPLVRLHSGSENSSSTVAAMLGFLRELQRKYAVAILLVHHMRKNSAGKQRDGQALRGSSDLHGWGDSNCYMRRERDVLLLSSEQRAAESFSNLPLRLEPSQLGGLALQVVGEPRSDDEDEMQESECARPSSPQSDEKRRARPSDRERIEAALRSEDGPHSVRRVRELSRMRTEKVCRLLKELEQAGVALKTTEGYFKAHGAWREACHLSVKFIR